MPAKLLNNFMEQVQDQSLPTIGLLQESFPNNTNFMINISTLFDPRYVFLIYAPVLFAFNRRVGHRMIIALTLAEWANQILKWLLAGERPYWYVHEKAAAAEAGAGSGSGSLHLFDHDQQLIANLSRNAATSAHHLQLKQFPVTCELGAGSPSGHSMVTATVWYILIAAHLAGELRPTQRANYQSIQGARRLASKAADQHQPAAWGASTWAKFSWSAYALILVLVGLSRVYLACHFPHQCLAGALLGALLAKLVAERTPMERLSRRHFAHATWLMLATVLATYTCLRLTGFDPLWSVSKAMRWCAKKEYIHLDTTPFFSMMRYLGFCLGAGLAYDSAKLSESGGSSGAGSGAALLARRLLTSLVSIGFGQFLLALPAPRSNLNLFYVISFIIYTLFSFAIAGPIPSLVKRLLPATCEQKSQQRSGNQTDAPSRCQAGRLDDSLGGPVKRRRVGPATQ